MKRILLLTILLPAFLASGADADPALFLNSFGVTATAYMNDSFLLLGKTADESAADVIPKEAALERTSDVQSRIRIVRGKLKAVSQAKIAASDKGLIVLLEEAFACLDQQAWALSQYIRERSPENARRFEEQRTECLKRMDKVAQFYATLPPSPEVPEPLSTR